MLSETLVQERVIGSKQPLHVLFLEQNAAKEEHNLGGKILAQLVGKIREDALVGVDRIELVEVEPLHRKSRHERFGPRVGKHP